MDSQDGLRIATEPPPLARRRLPPLRALYIERHAGVAPAIRVETLAYPQLDAVRDASSRRCGATMRGAGTEAAECTRADVPEDVARERVDRLILDHSNTLCRRVRAFSFQHDLRAVAAR